jgi:[CysO sulfur-carrier protein]-S-L-cysteine hydrolase
LGEQMDRLVLTRRHWEAMRDQVAADVPLESCGLLSGIGKAVRQVIPVPNALKSATRYRFDPHEQLAAFDQIEQDGLEMLAIYHSHPKGPLQPSPTDLAEAFYPVAYVIWSPQGREWQARGYWIENGVFSEVSLEISE